MELGFNIGNAGPLSQVGLQIISLDTAVHLATGAYGWWKARERSTSLVELLAADTGKLISPSSFNLPQYTHSRSVGIMNGIIIQEQSLQSLPLPKASTAVPADPGLACLRALTTGLLCFYSTEATVTILATLIPYGLIQFYQEGKDLKIEGPLLSSLRSFVSAVAVEEDCNSFRGFLLKQLATRQSDLLRTNRPTPIQEPHLKNKFEEPNLLTSANLNLVIGLLKWMLTPSHKRQLDVYPTRSLEVWSVSCVMESLGFQLSAFPQVVTTSDDYTAYCTPSRSGDRPDVTLVVGMVGTTDHMLLRDFHFSDVSALKPQLTPVRGIPWLAFRNFRERAGKVNTQYLVDVWNFSFEKARSAVAGLFPFRGMVNISIKPGADSQAVTELHRSLARLWSPHLVPICGAAMAQFVPLAPETDEWSPDALLECLRRDGENKVDFQRQGNYFVLVSIILGTIYGLACTCFIDNDRPMNLDSQIAFHSEIIVGRRLLALADAVGRGLDGTLSHLEWLAIICELTLGMNLSDGGQPLSHVLNREMKDRGSAIRLRTILGVQANGVAAISEMTIRPSSNLTTLIRFHICPGQILNLPLTEDGCIEGSTRREPLSQYSHFDQPIIQSLSAYDTSMPDPTLRIDVEPCWEEDPRTVVFRLRRNGVTIAPLNIGLILSKLSSDLTTLCDCDRPTSEVPVRSADCWRHLSIDSITYNQTSLLAGMAGKRKEIMDGHRYLIDASGSDVALLFAVGILECRNVVISNACLNCAYRKVGEGKRSGGTAIIVA